MDEETLDKQTAESIRTSLVTWFRENCRELPWRELDDPYAVWVSEVMLQQTQVATVIDYFNRWMEAFPTLQDLADAELDDVLGLWAGLGYYRRARMLHEASQSLRETGMPTTHAELLEVKGIGAYTAGAISSIAFGIAVPAVDGNVKRVVARLFALEDVWTSKGEGKVWEIAEELVDPESPGDFNEGMMELGATICRPKNPKCLLCPVRESCQAFALGTPETYPEPKPRKKPKKQTTRVVAHRRDDEVYVVRAEDGGLLGGLWGFPSSDAQSEDAPSDPVGEVVHVFSHIRMTYELHESSETPEFPQMEGRWVPIRDLGDLPMSVAMKKVAALLSMG